MNSIRPQLHLWLIILSSMSCRPEGLSPASPTIEVQPLALDFGPVPVGIAVSLPVQVRNLGRSDLVLRPATADLADFAGPSAELRVGAGARASVDVVFQPTVEGQRTGTVHLVSNAENDADVAIVLVGQGIARQVCADCNFPPANYCASSVLLIVYEPHGTCVADKCEYRAASNFCGGGCVAAPARCSAADGGVDAGPLDAGLDAGHVSGSQIFDQAGSWAWVVPGGVTSVLVKAWGGGGAGGVQRGATGGGGGFVLATLPVTPGESLEVRVAEGGRGPGNGAGASSLARGSTELIIAAGGGGGGSDGCGGCTLGAGGRGGAGGGPVGQAGQNFLAQIGAYCTSATGGQGGTATAGGEGGVATGLAHSCRGLSGQAGVGGRASGVNNACDTGRGAWGWHEGGGQLNGGGGGGGSGLYGGGGAGFIWTYCGGGGGGGSSHASATATGVSLVGGNGRTQGNDAESAGAGEGGADGVARLADTNGKDGRVVLTF